MSSNQKLVQSYLERHGIGLLFEDMMAKIIKDMPNEPVVYLLKMLQKINKKTEGFEKVFSPPLSRGMGLIGSSISKKHSSDPLVVLPGSKKVVSSWSKGDVESVASEESHGTKDRSYDKPWLANTKAPKVGSKNKTSKKSDCKNVDKDSKLTAHSFDDLFEQQNHSNKGHLSKSLPVVGGRDYETDNHNQGSKWSAPVSKSNKENDTLSRIQITTTEDDEIQIASKDNNNTLKKSTFSPSEYSKVKRHSSKKKAIQQKQKLQALLSNDESNGTSDDKNNNESTDDEGIDVLENDHDLACEGVESKSSGMKRPSHHGSDVCSNVTVSICSRCAKMIDGSRDFVDNVSSAEPFFKPSKRIVQPHSSFSDDNDDVESVSQIDTSKPFRPKWPVLSDSDTDDMQGQQNKQRVSSKSKGVNFNTRSSMETNKSDFFDKNSPLRKKTKPLGGDIMITDNDSETTFVANQKKSSPRHKPTSKGNKQQQAWKQQVVDSASEEENLKSTKLVKKGFKLKEALTDDASDVS